MELRSKPNLRRTFKKENVTYAMILPAGDLLHVDAQHRHHRLGPGIFLDERVHFGRRVHEVKGHLKKRH